MHNVYEYKYCIKSNSNKTDKILNILIKKELSVSRGIEFSRKKKSKEKRSGYNLYVSIHIFIQTYEFIRVIFLHLLIISLYARIVGDSISSILIDNIDFKLLIICHECDRVYKPN